MLWFYIKSSPEFIHLSPVPEHPWNKTLLTTQLTRLVVFCQSEQQDFLLTASNLEMIPVRPQKHRLWMNQRFCSTKAASRSWSSAILKWENNNKRVDPGAGLRVFPSLKSPTQQLVHTSRTRGLPVAPQTLMHCNPENPADVNTTKLSEPFSREKETAELRLKSCAHICQSLISLRSSKDGMTNPLLKAWKQRLCGCKTNSFQRNKWIYCSWRKLFKASCFSYNTGKPVIQSQATLRSTFRYWIINEVQVLEERWGKWEISLHLWFRSSKQELPKWFNTFCLHFAASCCYNLENSRLDALSFYLSWKLCCHQLLHSSFSSPLLTVNLPHGGCGWKTLLERRCNTEDGLS